MNSLMNVRFINEHNEIVNEPNEIMVVHDISSQKTLQKSAKTTFCRAPTRIARACQNRLPYQKTLG